MLVSEFFKVAAAFASESWADGDDDVFTECDLIRRWFRFEECDSDGGTQADHQ